MHCYAKTVETLHALSKGAIHTAARTDGLRSDIQNKIGPTPFCRLSYLKPTYRLVWLASMFYVGATRTLCVPYGAKHHYTPEETTNQCHRFSLHFGKKMDELLLCLYVNVKRLIKKEKSQN